MSAFSAPASLLARLHGEPLLVVDQPLPGAQPPLLACWLDEAGRLRENDDSPAAATVPLDGVPLGCMALVAFTSAGAQRLGRLAAHWRTLAPHTAPPFVDLSALRVDPNAVCALAEALADRLGSALGQAAELTRELVALRQHAERLRSTQRELAQAPQGPQCVFEAQPGAASTRAGAPVRQRLPASARGLAALDLHFEIASQAPGTLDLELWRLEEDALLARFSLPASELAPGWRRFVLGAAADCEPGTVELRARLPQGIALKLAEPRPGMSEPARLETGAALEAPLALRLYVDTPARPARCVEDKASAERVAALEASTSWRLTAPLRRLATFLRYLRSR